MAAVDLCALGLWGAWLMDAGRLIDDWMQKMSVASLDEAM